MTTAETTQRVRLDQLLVDTGAFASRSRARDAILRGTVRVSGMQAAKPGQMVPIDAAIDLDDPAQAYVSRAALKLKAALTHFDLTPKGRIALDVGASTGGFTQVLLEEGALTALNSHYDFMDEVGEEPEVGDPLRSEYWDMKKVFERSLRREMYLGDSPDVRFELNLPRIQHPAMLRRNSHQPCYLLPHRFHRQGSPDLKLDTDPGGISTKMCKNPEFAKSRFSIFLNRKHVQETSVGVWTHPLTP